MKRNQTTGTSGLPDVIEATNAIRQIAKAIRQDLNIRRFPSMDNDYSSVLSRIATAVVLHGKGLKELQQAAQAPSGAADVEDRLALQKAVLELIKAAQMLGEGL
jgi:hypothetical protein